MKEKDQKKEKEKRKFDFILIVMPFLLVLILWFLSLKLNLKLDDSAVTITNSIFSALAFAGVITAIYMQRKELILQRNELESTRKEFRIQNRTLKKQRFENTFFSMITIHHEITSRISIFHGSGQFVGRQAIWQIYEDFKGTYLNRIRKEGNPPIRLETAERHISFISDSFYKTYIDNERHLRHYFRNLATLVKFIHQSDLVKKSEKGFYYDVITSQVNSDEIALMHYYFNVGLGTLEREIYNEGFAGRLNASLLADVSHSYLLDPPFVYKTALADGKEFYVIREEDRDE